MNAAGVGHLVFSSTCATYGIPRQVPIDECHLQRPISPYGQSKLLAELAIHDHGLRHGLRWVILRYFNAAGLDPERDYASQREPAFRLIPRVLQTAAGFRNYLEVYGDSHPTEDGTAVRDYVHVKDLAAAHGSALHYLLGGGESRAFNLGNGTGYSVKQVIQAATRQTGKPLDFQIRPIRAGDPPKLVANAGAASSILNWRPQFPNLDEILRTSWKWYLQNQNRRSSVPKKNSTPPPLAKAAGS
jgi:UDP-glucose-4-epimerase GalE